MKGTGGLLCAIGVAVAVALAAAPRPAAACEWCTINFCGGTSVCGYGCSSQDGAWPVEHCTAHANDCEGETCFNEQQQLPDLTTVALVRDCELLSRNHGVTADRWRGAYDDHSLTDDPEYQAVAQTWGS